MTETTKNMTEIEFAEYQLRRRLERLVERMEETKQEFAEKIFVNSSGAQSAIQWYATDVIRAEVKGGIAERILTVADSDENGLDLIGAANLAAETLRGDLDRYTRYNGSSRSTNQYANTNEDVAVAAKAEILEEFFGLGGILSEANNLREKQEAAEENPAIEEIFTNQARALRRAMDRTVAEEKGAKTQKAKMAEDVAGQYLESQMNYLLTQARRYGVEIDCDNL